MNIVIILFFIAGLISFFYIIGKIRLAVQFDKEIKFLFNQSKNISHQIYRKSQLSNLPEPVQRYFNYTLKDGQPYISYARIKHNGYFKTGIGKNWNKIKGEQYATTEKPGFIWKGTMSLATARDMYIAGKGRLIVSLFSLFNVVNAKGEHYNQGELLRWLGESILYPTNLLPNVRLHWFPINATTAKLTFNYNGLALYFQIEFNEKGEITEMESKRYMNEKNIETWVIKPTNYKELNKVIIPITFNVLWRLEKGDFSYAKFDITEVEYDKPERF